MSGIHFVIDGAGKKTAVVIDLKRHGRLWEDFYDNLIAEERKNERRRVGRKCRNVCVALGNLMDE